MYTLTHPQQCPLLTALSQNLIVIIPAAPHCVCTTSATASPPQKPQWGTQTHIYGATVSPHHLWLHVERANHFTAPGGKQSCLSLWTNSFKLLQDFFFFTEAQLVYYKSTKLETGAHMLHTACVGLVFVHNFHQNISSWQHISLLQGEMGKQSFSVTCHNKHMMNMKEHEPRETTYLAHSLKAGGI